MTLIKKVIGKIPMAGEGSVTTQMIASEAVTFGKLSQDALEGIKEWLDGETPEPTPGPTPTRKAVQVGAGADYASVVFTNVGLPLSDNMKVTINKNDGDYLFVKYDKNDTLDSMGTDGFYVSVGLETAVVDGDYKYRKSINAMNAGETTYILNRK